MCVLRVRVCVCVCVCEECVDGVSKGVRVWRIGGVWHMCMYGLGGNDKHSLQRTPADPSPMCDARLPPSVCVRYLTDTVNDSFAHHSISVCVCVCLWLFGDSFFTLLHATHVPCSFPLFQRSHQRLFGISGCAHSRI